MLRSTTRPRVSGSLRALTGAALALAALAVAGPPAQAASLKKATLVDLIRYSDTIVAGRVERVSDGFDSHGMPYTEVTLKVGKKIRGNVAGQTFSFRQFGLLAPRPGPNGKVSLSVVPDGWAHYGVGEDVALFLGAPASRTGLRTTVGLKQGALAVVNGKIKRDEFNRGLFDGVAFDSGLLTPGHQALVEGARANQDIEVDQFLGLVRQAVEQDWVGKGRMKNAK